MNQLAKAALALCGQTCSTLRRVEPYATWNDAGTICTTATCSTLRRVEPYATHLLHPWTGRVGSFSTLRRGEPHATPPATQQARIRYNTCNTQRRHHPYTTALPPLQ